MAVIVERGGASDLSFREIVHTYPPIKAQPWDTVPPVAHFCWAFLLWVDRDQGEFSRYTWVFTSSEAYFGVGHTYVNFMS